MCGVELFTNCSIAVVVNLSLQQDVKDLYVGNDPATCPSEFSGCQFSRTLQQLGSSAVQRGPHGGQRLRQERHLSLLGNAVVSDSS